MKKTKRTYTPEFKQEAVRLANEKGASTVGRDLDVNESVIRRWVQESKNKKSTNSSEEKTNAELLKEIKRLKKENYYLSEINKVLKKSTAIFSKDQLPNT